jgi:hypothetical protein
MRILVLAAMMVAVPAAADSGSDRLVERYDSRQERQGARIDAGIASGQIGPREAQALARQQASLDRAYDRRLEDGRLSVRDARALERRFDNGSAAIRVARHRPRG